MVVVVCGPSLVFSFGPKLNNKFTGLAPVTRGEGKFNFYMLAVIHDNASFWPHFQVHFILHLTLFCPRLWRKRKGSISFSAEILGNFVNLGKMCWFLKLTSHQGCPGRGVSVRVRVGEGSRVIRDKVYVVYQKESNKLVLSWAHLKLELELSFT